MNIVIAKRIKQVNLAGNDAYPVVLWLLIVSHVSPNSC